MKPNLKNRFISILRRSLGTSALVLSFCGLAQAASQTYLDASSANTWNATDTNWGVGVIWNSGDDAVFGGTGEAVTVSAITAHNISFNSTGYLLSGGSITLNGSLPTIATSEDAKISSQLSGASGLVKTGSGMLILTGANNYSGNTSVVGGVLQLGDGVAQPTITGNYDIASGAMLRVKYNTSGASPQTWSRYTGAGTLAIATGKSSETNHGDLSLPAAFTGTLQIEGGRVYGLNSTSFGGTVNVVVKPGGHIGIWNVTGTFPQNFTLSGTGYGETNYEAAMRMASGGFTTTLSGNVAIDGAATIGVAGTAIFNNGIGEVTAGSNLTVGTGGLAGNVEIRGASSYTGTTTVNFGSLIIGSSSVSTSGSIYGGNIVNQVTVNANRVLRFSSTGVPHTVSGTIGGTGNITVQGTTVAAATLNVVAGAIMTPNQLVIGDTGIANHNQTGGSVTTSDGGNFWLANNPGGSGSTVTITGGTLNGGTGTSVIGVRGSYTFTVGGTAEVTFGTLQLGHTGGSTNNPTGRTVNLTGTAGSSKLKVNALNLVSGTALMNFDGGTLVANASFNPTSTIAMKVKEGGAYIDTASYNMNIGNALLHDDAGPATDGGLTKRGSGTLTLSGASSYNGPSTIEGGLLMLDGTAPDTEIRVNAGATFGVTATGKSLNSITLVSGSKLTLPPVAAQTTNVGTLNLTANPNFTVKPVFAAEPLVGTYNLLTPSSISGTAGTITTDLGAFTKARGVVASTALTGGNLVLTVTSTFTGSNNLVWNNLGGAGTGNWSAASPADNNFDNAGSPDSFYDKDNVAFNGAAPGTVNLVGVLYPSSIVVNSSAGDYTFAGSGSIGGATSLMKSGTSALTINTSNSFTGSVTLNAGILTLGTASALGAAPAVSFPSGSMSTLRMNGNSLTVSGLNNGFPYVGSAVIESGSATAGIDTLTANMLLDGVFTGILRNGGTRVVALTKNGSGTLTFAGSSANAFSGDTLMNVGRIGLSKTDGAFSITGNFIGDNGASPDVFATENNQFGPGSLMTFVNPNGDHVRFELLGTTQTLAGIDNTTSNGRGVIQHKEQVGVGEISNKSTLILNVAENANYYYNGYLRGNGTSTLALVKNGLGTQRLSGGNISHTGGTTVNAGILDFVLSNTMDKATGPWIINTGGTVRAVAAQNLIGGLTLNGGTLAGSGIGDVSYGHVVLGGNLTVIGTSASVISADLRIGSNNDRIFNVAVTGDASGIDLDVTGKIGHCNNVSWGFMTKTGLGTMRFSNSTLKSDIGRITLTQGKIIFQNMIADMGNGGLINNAVAELSTTTGLTLNYGGTISGTGLLEKTGLGSVNFTNNTSTFSGNININGGSLSLPARAGDYGNIVVASSARMTVNGSGMFRAKELALANGSKLEIGNFVRSLEISPMEAKDAISTAGTVSLIVPGIEASGVYPLIFYPFGGSVGGAGVSAFSLVSSSRSISGTIVDNVGNASVDLDVTVIPVKWKGNVGGGVWDIENTANWTFNSSATTYQQGDFLLFDDSATSFAVNLTVAVAPTKVTFNNTANDYTLAGSGAISGATQLTKDGSGKLTVTGSQTYTGTTTITGGTLRLGDGTTNGSIASVITNESVLSFNPAPTGQTYNGRISGTGDVVKEGGAILTVVANSNFTGDITVTGGTLIADAVSSGADTALGAADSSRTITVQTGAVLTFARSNAFGNHGSTSGPTLVVNGGTVTNADSASTGKVNNALNNVMLNSGTLTSTVGNGLSVIESWRPGEYYGAWGINGNITSTGASLISSTSPFGVIMLRSNAAPTIFDVQDGTLTVSTPLQSGDGTASGLTKMGAGKLVLSAANNYSAPTIVSEGTVVLNGSLLKAPGTSLTPGQERTPSNITVNTGAILAGGGTATGTVTIEIGGSVAPGNGTIDTLHTGATTISGTYLCDVGVATADGLAVTGNLDLTGATIDFASVGTPGAPSYIIATYTGSYAGGIPAVLDLPTGYTLQVDETNKQVKLVGSGGYANWAILKGLDGSNNALTADPDADGVSNQLEYYLDGNPLASDAGAILPAAELDGSYFILTFLRRDDAETEASSQLVQYSTNLIAWPKSVTLGATSAVADGNGVIVNVTENGANPDQIEVKIPMTQAVDGKLFGRLNVTMP